MATHATIAERSCVIYCRVSSKDQVDGTSLEMQEKACREFADRLGLFVHQVFIKRGESAKTSDRTEFTKAVALCTRKNVHVDYFVVYKLDRFARNQDDHVTVRAILRKAGTELRSVTEPINDSTTGRMMEGIISVFAEFDNNVRTERTKAGMLARIRQGIWCWSCPFGFHRPPGDKNISPDSAVAPYVRFAFEEFATGRHTYQSLADLLAAKGMKTRQGKRPCTQLMHKILSNSLYCGIIDLWGERVKGSFEPIVSEDLFYACQKNPRRKISISACLRSDNPSFPLRGFVVCSRCQKPLTGSSPRGRLGKHYPYYHHYDPQCSAARFIHTDELDRQFERFLSAVTPDPRFFALFQQTVIHVWEESYAHLDGVQNRLRIEIDELDAERQRVYEFHRQGKYSDEEFREQKEILTEQLQEKRHRLAEMNRAAPLDIKDVMRDSCDYIRRAPRIWRQSPLDQKRWFQNLVFEGGKVYYDGQNFGTQNLSLIYKLKETSRGEKSLLVALQGKHWNRLVDELKRWITLWQDKRAPRCSD